MGTCFRIHNDWNQTRINSITLELTFIDSDVYAVLKDFLKFQMKIYSVTFKHMREQIKTYNIPSTNIYKYLYLIYIYENFPLRNISINRFVELLQTSYM